MRHSSIFALFSSILALRLAQAVPNPLPTLHDRSAGLRGGCTTSFASDAPYDVSCTQLAAAIDCPNGVKGAKGGVVLLVHGTGSSAKDTWLDGPYMQILPNKGYDVCTVTIPGRSLDDCQTNAEYVAYAIQNLAPKSSTKKVSVIGHSQGNINIQWALAFWPSTQGLVSKFVSLAGDFKGTILAPIVTVPSTLLQGGAPAAFIQQTVGSKYITAQNKIAAYAIVPTTSVYTLTDDIIQPEVIDPTSEIDGAKLIATQWVCPLAVIDHFIMTVHPVGFYLALSALRNNGIAKLTDARCVYDPADISAANQFDQIPGLLRQTLDGAASSLANNQAKVEPALKKYVCTRGAATGCSA